MAQADFTVGMSDELKAAFEKTLCEIQAAKATFSEERIRQIVREELTAWEKRMVQQRRFGVPLHMETKEAK